MTWIDSVYLKDKTGWLGKDDIEGYKIPGVLRKALAVQFKVKLENVPETYGEFLLMLKDRGADFYINTGFLIVLKNRYTSRAIGENFSKIFKPISLNEMVKLRTEATYYMAY